MSEFKQFKDQNYLNLKTYRKNGEAMPTPVWFVQEGEHFYIRTVAESGKVKRIRNYPQVHIMPCGQRGEPLGTWANAQAIEVTDKDIFTKVKSLSVAKYGEMVQAMETQVLAKGQEYTVLLVKPEKA